MRWPKSLPRQRQSKASQVRRFLYRAARRVVGRHRLLAVPPRCPSRPERRQGPPAYACRARSHPMRQLGRLVRGEGSSSGRVAPGGDYPGRADHGRDRGLRAFTVPAARQLRDTPRVSRRGHRVFPQNARGSRGWAGFDLGERGSVVYNGVSVDEISDSGAVSPRPALCLRCRSPRPREGLRRTSRGLRSHVSQTLRSHGILSSQVMAPRLDAARVGRDAGLGVPGRPRGRDRSGAHCCALQWLRALRAAVAPMSPSAS